MKVIFLGTGTSQGVPMIGPGQEGLNLDNPKNWRTRSSIHVEVGGLHVQVDAGPEFRMQCLSNKIDWIDLFILTHGHADHIAGMDDLRRFSERMDGDKLPVYANDFGSERIRLMFPYALYDKPTQRGYPCFDLRRMPTSLKLENGAIILSEELPHGDITSLGLVFEHEGKKIAYYNDAKMLTPRAVEMAKNADVAILDGLRPFPHPTHMSIHEAVEAGHVLEAKKVYITHTTWQIDYDEWSAKLPGNMEIAYDGLTFEV